MICSCLLCCCVKKKREKKNTKISISKMKKNFKLIRQQINADISTASAIRACIGTSINTCL